MTEIKIEKNVPLPPIRREGYISWEDIPARMEPGDCIPKGSVFDKNQAWSARGTIQRFKKSYPGRRYTVRLVGKGYRVWRIE